MKEMRAKVKKKFEVRRLEAFPAIATSTAAGDESADDGNLLYALRASTLTAIFFLYVQLGRLSIFTRRCSLVRHYTLATTHDRHHGILDHSDNPTHAANTPRCYISDAKQQQQRH